VKKSPCYYALHGGKPLLVAREAKGWNQRELARQSRTSSTMISKLEGIVGHRVSEDAASQIAKALELSIEQLFTLQAPTGQFGERTRPTTPPQQRYDGSAQKAHAERWRQYVAAIRAEAEHLGCGMADVDWFDWPEKLSLVRAAERFDLNAHTLAKAADAKRVPGRRARGRGPGGVEWQFDERKLAEALQELPSCGYEGCEVLALGPSGGCEAHGHALDAMCKKRPVEVCRAIMKTKRENPKERRDAKDRAHRLHDARRKRLEDELAPGELTRSGAATALGIVPHGINALVADGELEVTRYIEHEIGQSSPIFTEVAINARKRKVALAESGPEAWPRSLPLDPERAVDVARADGRLARLTETLGSENLAKRVIREQTKTKRAEYVPHKAGAPSKDGRRERLRGILDEVQADEFFDASEFTENELLAYVATLNWQRNREDFPPHWPGDEDSYDPGYRKNAVEQMRRLVGREAKKALQIAATKSP
jgi:transcriptional regulator with XRE-family HTH domain